MDFVKREDQNIDEENYKIYMETLQKSHQMEVQDYQHTPISMEQLHQAMQTSLNGTIMHNFQLPLSPRQMSTLMLKTNHLSRNLNFNEIPAHLQRNLELDLVHNLVDMPQNLRHDDLLSRNLDLNLARSLNNDLELQSSLTQSLVQNLNENMILSDGIAQNIRNDMHDINQEIDLSHHLNRNIEHQEILNHERRTPVQCVQDAHLLEQSLGQRMDPTLHQRLEQSLGQRLDQTLGQRLEHSLGQRLEQSLGQRLDQRLVTQNLHVHSDQRLDSEHLLPMPFHIKSEQEDDSYFYENINQPLPNVSSINGHIPQDHSQTTQANINPDQMYVYTNQINVPINTAEHYSRQNYPQNYATARDNPQNLVVHRQYENSSPYDETKKDHRHNKDSKLEEPKENMKPNDQNKMYYQDYQQEKSEMQKSEEVSLDIKGEYGCYKCNSVFPSKRLLKQHTKTCSEPDSENSEKSGKFSCSQCSYRCQAPATLKIHERTHTGEKPFSCTFCDYKSGQKNNVAKHILVHMKEKPFRCQYCDYRCAQKNNLVVHERTHTGYKPFACPYCDYRTVQKPNLVKHMYLHTDQKPFSCDVCNYRCVQKTNLTKHKQRHMNEKDSEKIELKGQIKPYRPRQKSVKCPHCPYRCVQKASLEKHIVFKHNEFNEQGLNLMKSGNEEESIQNLSVKRDEHVFECIPQDVKESLQVQS
ncbi:unnamed protein product [Diatraea saccharalis]|uniref:C2H2-type domain-containing protein n=1 Tax=Diatraea saccharalis TaxID=40085 RepID=A0A9N9REF2_9NEOP|nr:unnamed protein product [Diatraea saccharalis]